MNHYVYLIVNNINNKKYIGKRSCSCPIEQDNYMGSGKVLKQAQKKYGIDNFTKHIMLVCDSEEQAYIEEEKAIELVKADTNPQYYNIAFGGKGGVAGVNISKETRKKMSVALKGHKVSEETRRKISIAQKGEKSFMYGKKLSKDVCIKMSESRKGEKNYNAKKVILLNTEEIFDTILQATIKFDIPQTGISNCCLGNISYTGKVNGEPAVWRYLDDVKGLNTDDYKKIINSIELTNKKVRCLNTKEIFNSIVDAGIAHNVDESGIIRCCKNNQNYTTNKDNIPLTWMYEDEYLVADEVKINNKLNRALESSKRKKSTDIICVNTNEYFPTVEDASVKYNLQKGNIIKCCECERKSCGTLDKEPMVWMYLEEYNKLTNEQIKEKLEKSKIKEREYNGRFIICVNNKEIFEMVSYASEQYGINVSNIVSCCRGRFKSAGKHPETGEKLVWMYLEDYENKYGAVV